MVKNAEGDRPQCGDKHDPERRSRPTSRLACLCELLLMALSRKLLRGFVLFAKPTFDIRTSGIPPISKTKRYASALPKAHVKAGQQRADVFRATPLQLFKRTRIVVHFVFLD